MRVLEHIGADHAQVVVGNMRERRSAIDPAQRVDAAADDAVLKEARRGKCDLIILGVTRRPGETLTFGGMADKLLANSSMSILFVAS